MSNYERVKCKNCGSEYFEMHHSRTIAAGVRVTRGAPWPEADYADSHQFATCIKCGVRHAAFAESAHLTFTSDPNQHRERS